MTVICLQNEHFNCIAEPIPGRPLKLTVYDKITTQDDSQDELKQL